MSELLRVSGLVKNFGGLAVSSNVNISLKAGERCALIGPNGAGKTTFVNLVTGVLKPSAGAIYLDGHDVTKLPPQARVQRGLIRSFQIARLFPSLTVREHVHLALLQRGKKTFRLFGSLRPDAATKAEIDELLAIMGLSAVAETPISALAYGLQRLLEIALALALKPKVLILDEPAAGVPHSESHRILDALDRLPADLAVLMIDHDMDLVFRFAHRIIVLAQGQVLCSGTAAEISADPKVRDVYLGSRARERA
jgi:branched-chain amino acid transport system ATP-binding protein